MALKIGKRRNEPRSFDGPTRPGPDAGSLHKGGSKALHPHWRGGGRKRQAQRLYANAKSAHAHTKVRP